MTDSERLKKYIVWEPLLLAAMVALGMIVGSQMKFYSPEEKEEVLPRIRTSGEVEELLRFIEAKYVEDVDGHELTRKAIDAILNELDPHSQYLSPRLREELDSEMNGEYIGIGLEKIRVGDSLYVVSVSQGSPAAEAGIEPGDRIIRILDSINVDSTILGDSLSFLIRGDKGTKIALTLERSGGDTFNVDLTREIIPLPAIDLSVMLNDSVGYIKVNRFSNDIYKNFMQRVEALAEEGLDDLIVDLRGNPGGYLQEAVKILSQLIEKKESLLVYTEGANSKRTEYKSTGRRFYEIDDIVVLTDAGSASASEIMAGALQDLDRGLIVGRRTFGKGLVQEQYQLNNGGALRLTTAKYFTPSGRLIQRDYSDMSSYQQDMINRDLSGENRNEELMPIEDSTEHYTTSGRIVYGGGGIIPDIFIAKNNPFSAADWPSIEYQIQAWTVRHLDLFKTGSQTVDGFVERFELNRDELNELIDHLMEEVPVSDLNTIAAENYVSKVAKAYIGKMKFNEMAVFHKVMNRQDPVIEEALGLIEENKISTLLAETHAISRE